MNRLLLPLLFIAAVCLCGCRATYTLNVTELLQLPASAKLYTAGAIWYENAEEIDPRNFQKGSFIPFGTEVQVVEATNKEITLRTVADGKTYTIIYDESWMIVPAETYLRQYITAATPVQMRARMTPVGAEMAQRGKVIKGMTREEVLRAWGYPHAARNPDLTADTWLYYDDIFKAKRVIFRNDKVDDFLTLE